MAVFLPTANRGPFVLAAAQGATGTSAGQINTSPGYTQLVIQAIVTTGPATIQIEQSIDGGATWFLAQVAQAGVTTTAPFIVQNPFGLYRANVTALTAGSVQIQAAVGSRSYY